MGSGGHPVLPVTEPRAPLLVMADPRGKHRCTICCKTYKRAQDLKAHRTRTGHFDSKKEKVTQTAEADAVTQKRKDMQNALPKVHWGERPVDNV